MIKSIRFSLIKNTLIYLMIFGILFFNFVNTAWAKRPPEIRNQQDLDHAYLASDPDLADSLFQVVF